MKDRNIAALAEAFCKIYAPFCEVILHDLAAGSVTAVYGSQSGRKVGDPSFLEELGVMDWTRDLHGPYRKTSPDGRSIKSISVVLRDEAGKAQSLLCINTDISNFELIRPMLDALTHVLDEELNNPLANDWLEKLNAFVAKWTMDRNIQIKHLTITDRRNLIRDMQTNGVFKQKNAAQAVAAALGISRATVYQDLRSLE